MKRLPLLVTAVADDDIRQAASFYVAEGSTAVAIAFVEAVERTFLHVRTHPGAGSPRYAHELDIPGLRSWPVAGFPYLVFYRMEAHTLTVWRVLHAERDIPEHLQAPE
ncbi:MAG: type II toxin-antitoxin system RelE/ParE family toxin [Longimicrobiales bacterium]|nr:type II toxin-antitoxin system RelE/ParE family toxin [Longimicrobiales bacterium]